MYSLSLIVKSYAIRFVIISLLHKCRLNTHITSFCFNCVTCSLMQYGSHSKKRPNNLVLGRTYDHHIYDLVEVGIENFKSMISFSYDKKLAPQTGSKPFFAFIGEAFESVDELKHLKEILLDLFRGEVSLNYCFGCISIACFYFSIDCV